jgi:hypothetical protein
MTADELLDYLEDTLKSKIQNQRALAQMPSTATVDRWFVASYLETLLSELRQKRHYVPLTYCDVCGKPRDMNRLLLVGKGSNAKLMCQFCIIDATDELPPIQEEKLHPGFDMPHKDSPR